MIGERNDDEQLEIRGPMGVLLRARGQELIKMILLLLCFLAVIYFIWKHDTDGAAHDELLAKNQMAIHESVSELIYVTSLSPQEREKIKISMPESLRKKLRDSGDR